mgnify:FL=1
MPVLGASKLGLQYADIEIFADVTIQIEEKSKIGIVGPNGSGKSSLVKVLLGRQDFDFGEIFRPDNLKIGYVPQTAMEKTGGTLRQQIMTAFSEIIALEDAMAESAIRIQKASNEDIIIAQNKYSSLLEEYESVGGYDYNNNFDKVADGVGLYPDALDTLIADASGGERTRAALATALLTNPDLLVLDEPTNYLDFKGLEWLEGFLSQFDQSYMVVSHDRYFLDKVASDIWELNQGTLKTYKGNYSKYTVLKSEEALRHAREYEKQQTYIKREENFIARYHAGQRSKEARGRAKKLTRLERVAAPTHDSTVTIRSTPASRTGLIVLSTHDLKIGYHVKDDPVTLVEIPDIEILRQSTTAIIGNNGVGKTTFIKTFLGEIAPLKGSIQLGHNVKMGYFRQGSDEINGKITVMEALLEKKNVSIGEARNFLARFLFKGDEMFSQVDSLSGGERGRLALARLLITEPNVLILDEPTTHLDIQSRESLESMLEGYDGTIIFVSHDRQLISMLADNLLVIDQGKLYQFQGSYTEWVEEQKKDTPKVRKIQDPVSRTNKKQAKKRSSNKKAARQPSKVIETDYESIINELESSLTILEQKLENASASGNVQEVMELGQKHRDLTNKLESTINEWGN